MCKIDLIQYSRNEKTNKTLKVLPIKKKKKVLPRPFLKERTNRAYVTCASGVLRFPDASSADMKHNRGTTATP